MLYIGSVVEYSMYRGDDFQVDTLQNAKYQQYTHHNEVIVDANMKYIRIACQSSCKNIEVYFGADVGCCVEAIYECCHYILLQVLINLWSK